LTYGYNLYCITLSIVYVELLVLFGHWGGNNTVPRDVIMSRVSVPTIPVTKDTSTPDTVHLHEDRHDARRHSSGNLRGVRARAK